MPSPALAAPTFALICPVHVSCLQVVNENTIFDLLDGIDAAKASHDQKMTLATTARDRLRSMEMDMVDKFDNLKSGVASGGKRRKINTGLQRQDAVQPLAAVVQLPAAAAQPPSILSLIHI